jgi:hypothetical protein
VAREAVKVWAGYRIGLDRYADLGDVWARDLTSAPLCSSDGDGTADASILCTAGRSGVRHRGTLELRRTQAGWRLGALGGIEYIDANEPRFRGPLAYLQVWSSRDLGPGWRLNGAVLASIQHAGGSGGPTVRALQPEVALKRDLSSRTALWLTWRAALSTQTDESGKVRYFRQLPMLEVTHAF